MQYLLGKFHSRNAYREGVHWHRKTQLGKGGQAQCYSIQDVKTQMIMALKEVIIYHHAVILLVILKLSDGWTHSNNLVFMIFNDHRKRKIIRLWMKHLCA